MSELKTIARHTGTVLAGQLAVMAFGVTDTIVSGQYSADALAALSIASAIFVSVYISLMGVLQALLPIWSELHGQKKHAHIGQSFRQSLYLATLATAVGMVLLLSPAPLLQWSSVPLSIQPEVTSYLRIVALALPGALFFRLFSTLNQSLGLPQLVTWLQILSLLPKIGLSIWFTSGGLGIAPQGAAGCAWATLVVQYGTMALAIFLLRTRSIYTPLKLWQPLEKPDLKQLAAFARLGVPAGLSIGVEVTSFTLMALLIARQGSMASASHQIAANVAAVCYMVPLSLSIAASARVSYWLGAKNIPQAQLIARSGLRLALASGITIGTLVLLLRHWIVNAYTHDTAVTATAATLLFWVALYHMADSLQCYCIFVLRCLRITIAPLITYTMLLWGVGLGGGYTAAYLWESPWGSFQDTAAFWAFSFAALAATAIIFLIFLRHGLMRAELEGPATR